jgi:hypothetical protein
MLSGTPFNFPQLARENQRVAISGSENRLYVTLSWVKPFLAPNTSRTLGEP